LIDLILLHITDVKTRSELQCKCLYSYWYSDTSYDLLYNNKV